MNAIILAGGEQASLLPLSLGTPAAMLPLLGRPVMEHTVALLRRCGFTRLYAVMGREDRAVGEHFGDGSRLGVQLTCVERAGPPDAVESLRRCLALAGDAPARVISGRWVCDLDLRRAAEEHQRRGAAATLVLCRADGGGRGLAVTDGAGRVERLLEPPAWERGAAGPVFTGICVLSPGALARLPEGEPGGLYRGLLPALLRRGERLHSVVLEGGWREIEDCGSYLAC